MARYEVTKDSRTFQQIYLGFKAQGIEIDHFHCVDADGEVAHINYEYVWDEFDRPVKDPDGGYAVHFNHDWMSQTGNSPSNFKVTYNHSNGSSDTYAVKVVADEWHEQGR